MRHDPHTFARQRVWPRLASATKQGGPLSEPPLAHERQRDLVVSTASTFTGRKIDWLKCCNFDRRLEPYDFKVAFVIQQHLNERTGTCQLSDETIADEAGGSTRNVRRARNRLRDGIWISWERTSTANIYRLCFDNVERILDMITAARDERRERRQRRRTRFSSATPIDRTSTSYLNRSERSPRSQHERPTPSSQDRTLTAAKHLRGNTSE